MHQFIKTVCFFVSGIQFRDFCFILFNLLVVVCLTLVRCRVGNSLQKIVNKLFFCFDSNFFRADKTRRASNELDRVCVSFLEVYFTIFTRDFFTVSSVIHLNSQFISLENL